jgi:esterase/lipase superfamily enzyme
MIRLLSVSLVFLLGLAVAACSPRGYVSMGSESAALAAGGSLQTIFVATDRVFDQSAEIYGNDRIEDAGFARFTVSIPPERAAGSIEWPRGQPDFQTEFVTVEAAKLPEPNFFRALDAQLAQLPRGEREIVLFIHGFNTNYPEAFYRQAQMMHDFGVRGVGVTYAWASAGSAFGYVHDRDSVLYARDSLSQLIEQLQRTRAEEILIVAHSMGGLLTVETLRTLALRGNGGSWGKLGAVILISPDIAVDVFRTQARDIGTLPQPFVIFTSNQDRALALSAGLSGQRDRLGSLPSVDPIDEFEVTLINLTEIEGGDPLRHMTAVTSPASIAILNQINDFSRTMAAEQIDRRGLLPGTVLSIRNATEVIIDPLQP